MRQISYAAAGMEAMLEEMRRDPRTLHLATDAPPPLVKEFGPQRVRGTPIYEAAFTGLAIGAAGSGYRPIVNWSMVTFGFVAMDQIVNQTSKIHYMFGGQAKFPLVFRASVGGGRQLAAQHSQSPYYMFMNLAGLKMILPSTPYDMKGLLKSAIRDDNPVISFESSRLMGLRGDVPEEEYLVPLGVADIKREGSDITLIATSSMVKVALGAAKLLDEYDISAEVVDPRTLWPLDEKTLIESAKKTSRVIVIDEGYERYGITGEIASMIASAAFYDLEAPVKRMGAMHVPIPFSPPLEDVTVPTERSVFEAARALCAEA